MTKNLINWSRVVFITILMSTLHISAYANEGIEPEKGSNTSWKAKWIWQENDGPNDTWMCLRKNISLDTNPRKAIARISADSKYWLWINGELVVFEGQLRRDRLEQTYFDVIDLTSYLKAGENTIAVLVWFWGKEGFSHHNSGKGGFLFEGNFGNTSLISDSTWKTHIHPGYEHSATGGQPNFRLPIWNIRFNAKNDSISNWQLADFDDTKWVYATEKGIPPALPWNRLEERPFPKWKDSGLKEYENTKTVQQSGINTIEATLPYNARVTAYLKVEAPEGKLINIQTDQYDGWLDFGEGPANRVEYITKNGIQEFETYAWMSGNTVRYSIPEGVKVISLKYRELSYPANFTGAFTCNDMFYNRLWDMAGRTLYINMFDNFMDCPDREQALWWGDVVNQSGEVFYTLDTNAHALIRKSIITLIDWQREDSTLFCPPSTLWKAELPQQLLASIGWYGFWNYFMNTNDSTSIREVYPAVRKYLGIWKMGQDGLVVHRKGGWDWGDWGDNIDIEMLDNCWYYLALKAAIPMAAMSGYANDTSDYSKRMQSIKDKFSSVFWVENEQYFRSKKLVHPDDRANAMAVVAGLAKPEQFSGIRKVLGNQMFASPYMEKYVLEALCKIGSETLALERMKKRYSEMVQSSYSTLWEVWNGLKGGTINHGWNAPNTILSHYIAGLYPLQPGWSCYQVMPQMGELKQVGQIVPTIKGNIKVNHTVTGDSFITELSSPNGTEAIIGIPKKHPIDLIRVNGKTIWKKGKYRNKVKGISGAGEDADFIKFSVEEGNWQFNAALSKLNRQS